MKKLMEMRYVALVLSFVMLLVACSKEEEAKIEISGLGSSSQMEVVGPQTSFTVNSNVSWTLSQSGDINYPISPKSGEPGSTVVNVTYVPNTSGKQANTTITITAGGAVASFTLVQSPMEFKMTPSDVIEFEAAASTKSIEIESNTTWNVNGITIPDWIQSVTASASSGNGSINISVKENTNRLSANVYLLKVSYGGSMSKSIEVKQAAAFNNPPTKAQPLYPADGETGVSVMPMFQWEPSTDEEGDDITYSVMISSDQTNWRRISAGSATSVSLPSTMDILEVETEYFWKVQANDMHYQGITESDVYSFTTGSKDAYSDGEYTLYMESSKENPVVLVFTGDGYLQEDHKFGGAFDKDVDEAIEAFFDIEPYRSYREYFTVYKIAAYSNERGLTNKKTNSVKDTRFRLEWEGGNSTGISCPNSGAAVFDLCKTIPGVTEYTLNDMAIGIVINADVYAGTCLSFSTGKSIAMIPYLRTGTNMTKFGNVVRHEMGGHGFGRLSDEYQNFQTSIPDDEKENMLLWQSFGYGLNCSAYPAMKDSPWAHFEGLSDYSHVGMYEGGHYYAKGVWRPEQISCMEDNRDYYNSPSRFFIVKRILEVAGEVEPIESTDSDEVKAAKMKILMDLFIAKDVEKKPSNTKAAVQVPYDFVPLGKPVMIVE